MTRALALFVVLSLSLTSCQRNAAGPSAIAEKKDVNTYKLDLEMYGLIAFVEESDGVWALLPKTQYDPMNPQEADLPPFVLAKLRARHLSSEQIRDELLANFPTHVATLQLTNATVTQGSTVTQDPPPILLAGKDVRFLGISAPFEKPALDLLADTQHVLKTMDDRQGFQLNTEQRRILPRLDAVDRSLLNTNLDSRLTARARLDFGRLVAQVDSDRRNKVFTFRFPIQPAGCTHGPAIPLGEEVVASVEGLQSGFRIRLDSSGNELLVEPTDRGHPLIVRILYRDPQHRDDHPEAFRWFHRLSADTLGSGDLHFRPCQQPPFGGNKCPIIKLIRQ